MTNLNKEQTMVGWSAVHQEADTNLQLYEKQTNGKKRYLYECKLCRESFTAKKKYHQHTHVEFAPRITQENGTYILAC